jgi:two-component system response regulator
MERLPMTSNSPITLVMVDDNADDIFLTRRQLRSDKIVNHFHSEKNPERLIAKLLELQALGIKSENILILLDVKMPRLDGFETLRKLREYRAFKDIPVIMLSASDDESDMFEAFELGAKGYIVKPFKGDEFFAALSNLNDVKYRLVQ